MLHSSRRRLVAVAIVAVGLQVAAALPVGGWHERLPGVATALGIAIAVAAGALGGLPAGLVVATAGWALDLAFVADAPLAAVALPAWLLAGGLAGWLADRTRQDSRERDLVGRQLDAVRAAGSDAIVSVDADGTIRGWSRGAEALYGYTSAAAGGRPLADLLGGDDAPERADRLLAAARAGETATEEATHQRSDGSLFSGSASLVPIAADGGAPDGALLVSRDVGKLRRTSARLREAEAKYRSLVEHLPVVTYVRPANGEEATTYVSRQIDHLLGYSADEWLADPGLHARLVHPEDRDRVRAERAAAAAKTKPLRSEYRMVARDGRVVWVRDEAATVLDDGGRPLCIQGYLLDVGERKAADEERRELRAAEAAASADARARQRTIDFMAEASALLVSSSETRASIGRVAARAARDLADWCIVDVLEEDGTLVRLVTERVEPASSLPEPGADPEPDAVDVVSAGRPELSESQMRLPLVSRSGRRVGVMTLLAGPDRSSYTADDLAWGQALAALVALTYDNARLYAEVEARADANRVLTYVADGVFLVDRSGLVRLWNPAAEAITGVPSSAALGKPAAEAIPGWPELSERVPVRGAQEPVAAETLPLDTERGERWISISGVEFFGGTVFAFRDSTEAHRLDELQADFIATASHELRTPLAAVYGAAQTLRRHDFALDDAGRERFISLIIDESDRLGRIVNQILLANQLDVGRLDLVTEPFDAADLLERVVEAARTHAPPGISLGVRAAEDVPPVAADKDRARQILVNLVENAIKYSPDGGRIELSVEPAGEMVLFRVADEGIGIPAEEQPRIFEKFYRLDPGMTRGIGGTGLGLYICSELVERMGGSIWVESGPEKGSAFFFELPSAGPHRARPGRARAVARGERAEAAAGDAA